MKISITELLEMWAEDGEIDMLEPDKEIVKVSKLHAKYLGILTHYSLLVKKYDNEYKKRKRIMWEYYCGDLNNPSDLEEYGLEPFTKRALRQDIPMYLDADDSLTEILTKKMVNQEIVDACTSILKELNGRVYALRAYMDWQKFQNGA